MPAAALPEKIAQKRRGLNSPDQNSAAAIKRADYSDAATTRRFRRRDRQAEEGIDLIIEGNGAREVAQAADGCLPLMTAMIGPITDLPWRELCSAKWTLSRGD